MMCRSPGELPETENTHDFLTISDSTWNLVTFRRCANDSYSPQLKEYNGSWITTEKKNS